jgi:glutamate-1-semialdehyde aminotransferase
MAGIAFLDYISNTKEFYPKLLNRAQALYKEMNSIFQRKGVSARVQGVGCRFSILFGPASKKKPRNYREALEQDSALSNRFYLEMMKRGVFFHSMWHHGITGSHTDADIAEVLEAVEDSCNQLVRG